MDLVIHLEVVHRDIASLHRNLADRHEPLPDSQRRRFSIAAGPVANDSTPADGAGANELFGSGLPCCRQLGSLVLPR